MQQSFNQASSRAHQLGQISSQTQGVTAQCLRNSSGMRTSHKNNGESKVQVQGGLFPKIQMVRQDGLNANQSSAPGVNVLVSSGGHISGMGNDRTYLKGVMVGPMTSSQGFANRHNKPLSSPIQPQNQISGDRVGL
jgi:hypothetical protein